MGEGGEAEGPRNCWLSPLPLSFSPFPPDLHSMPRKSVSAKSALTTAKPGSGPVALLRAMGFSAVQVAPEIVALRTPVRKA